MHSLSTTDPSAKTGCSFLVRNGYYVKSPHAEEGNEQSKKTLFRVDENSIEQRSASFLVVNNIVQHCHTCLRANSGSTTSAAKRSFYSFCSVAVACLHTSNGFVWEQLNINQMMQMNDSNNIHALFSNPNFKKYIPEL